jgi:hypothetical protein
MSDPVCNTGNLFLPPSQNVCSLETSFCFLLNIFNNCYVSKGNVTSLTQFPLFPLTYFSLCLGLIKCI